MNPGEGAYKWDGSDCIWVDPACGCTGADCDSLFMTEGECDAAYSGCNAGPDACCLGVDALPSCEEGFAPGESCEGSGPSRCCDPNHNAWACDCGEACGIWYEHTCP